MIYLFDVLEQAARRLINIFLPNLKIAAIITTTFAEVARHVISEVVVQGGLLPSVAEEEGVGCHYLILSREFILNRTYVDIILTFFLKLV